MRLSWQGKAVFLLGSTEHYGALLNAAFDYERYLDTIAADRLNLTRVFAIYREQESSLGGQIGYANPVAPRPEDYLAPWARASAQHGLGPDGLPKFDLDTWDERYFARLRAFLSAATARNVFVEIELFNNPWNPERWVQFPLNPDSNVNGVGAAAAHTPELSLFADPSVIEQQRRFVRKLVSEANEFDNVYFEICGEPSYTQGGEPRPDLVRDWQRMMIETVRETERRLPKRHLVAVNAHQVVPLRDPEAGEIRAGLLDDGFYRHDPEVDLLNVHYISHRLPREGLLLAYPGGTQPRAPAYRPGHVATFLALRAAARTAIGFAEDYSGFVHRQVPHPAQARMEAWESLLAGCATYDHLDFTFTSDDPTGAALGVAPEGLPQEWFDGRAMRRQLSFVAEFAASLDLTTLRHDLLLFQQVPVNTVGIGARAGGGSESLIVYLADSRRADAGFGSSPLGGTLRLVGVRPGSVWTVRALDPRSGEWIDLPGVTAAGTGDFKVDVAPFQEDLLLLFALAGDGA